MESLRKFSPLIEKILIGVFIVGVLLGYVNINGTFLIQIGFLGLALLYFLNMFMPPPVAIGKPEFKELLGLVVAPRVINLASSISVLGIYLYWRSFGNPNYKQAVLLGAFTLLLGLLSVAYVSFVKTPGLKPTLRLVPRAIVLLSLDVTTLLQGAPMEG